MWLESGSLTHPAASAPICSKPHRHISPPGRRLLFPTALHPEAHTPKPIRSSQQPVGLAGGTDEETDPERRRAMPKAHRGHGPAPHLTPQCCSEAAAEGPCTLQPEEPTKAKGEPHSPGAPPGRCEFVFGDPVGEAYQHLTSLAGSADRPPLYDAVGTLSGLSAPPPPSPCPGSGRSSVTAQPPARRGCAGNGSRRLTRTLSSTANGPTGRNCGHPPSTDDGD